MSDWLHKDRTQTRTQSDGDNSQQSNTTKIEDTGREQQANVSASSSRDEPVDLAVHVATHTAANSNLNNKLNQVDTLQYVGRL